MASVLVIISSCQTQLFEELVIFCCFLLEFWNLYQVLNFFKHNLRISETIDSEKTWSPKCIKGSQRVDESPKLLESAEQNLCPIFLSL